MSILIERRSIDIIANVGDRKYPLILSKEGHNYYYGHPTIAVGVTLTSLKDDAAQREGRCLSAVKCLVWWAYTCAGESCLAADSSETQWVRQQFTDCRRTLTVRLIRPASLGHIRLG